MQRRPIPLISAGAAALAFAFAPSPAHASTSQFSIFEAPREVLGFDDMARQSALDDIKSFGVTHTRVLLKWNAVLAKPDARTKPADLKEKDSNSAGYNFAKYDAIFTEAADRGIEVIPTITGDAPKWATAGKRGKNYKVSRDAFERFVEAVGSRYGTKVKTWTIWNEPNQPQFLTPQYVGGKPYSPHLYRALYQAALQGLGATGNGSDKVLAGETSPAGNANIVAPIPFLRIFFSGRKLKVDGYAHHPYSKKTGPFYTPRSKNDVTIGVLSRLTKALDRYSHHRGLKLYLTEFGIQSTPDPNYGVSLGRQNEYRAISEKLAYANPRVAAFSQYLLRDDLPRCCGSKYAGFESGLLTSTGKAKPAFAGYRLPLVAHKGRLWGLVRPDGGANATVTIQFKDSGAWKDLADVKTNSRGYWTKRTTSKKGRVYRVKWMTFTSPTTHAY